MNRMKSMFTGAIALVAGLALSAGSAFATAGYVSGDPAMMKLVPYFETGGSKATIIGIQNLSPREVATTAQHKAVADAQKALDDLNEMDEPNLQEVANAEKALADAREALQTEHLFVSVNVYDAMGMMMDDASSELCLSENQFGYVILQEPEMTSEQEDIPNRSDVLSVMADEIPEYGYVEISANDRWSACMPTAGARGEAGWSQIAASGTGRIAAWAVIQDTSDGFFGTEVPTATISMSSVPGIAADSPATGDPEIKAGDPMLACYSGDETVPARDSNDNTMADDTGVASNMTGDFMMSRCGLIPERHDNSRNDDGTPDTTVEADGDTTDGTAPDRSVALSATPRATALARYDIGDETMVYLWLAEGDDAQVKPHARDSRRVDVDIKCEDGGVIDMMEDQYGDMVPITIAAPNKLTRIDPAGDELGDLTAMCEGGTRGALKFTMPDGSTAGMVFSHITQMMGHYRMNFPGYGMADPMTCYEMGPAGIGDIDGDGVLDEGETLIDVNGDGNTGIADADDLAAARVNACK